MAPATSMVDRLPGRRCLYWATLQTPGGVASGAWPHPRAWMPRPLATAHPAAPRPTGSSRSPSIDAPIGGEVNEGNVPRRHGPDAVLGHGPIKRRGEDKGAFTGPLASCRGNARRGPAGAPQSHGSPRPQAHRGEEPRPGRAAISASGAAARQAAVNAAEFGSWIRISCSRALSAASRSSARTVTSYSGGE